MKILLSLFILIFPLTVLSASLEIDDKKYTADKEDQIINKLFPAEQLFLKKLNIDGLLIEEGNKLTKVALQKMWIDKNVELCNSKSFNVFEEKINWIGRLRIFNLREGNHFNAWIDIDPQIVIPLKSEETKHKKPKKMKNYLYSDNISLEGVVKESDLYNLESGFVVKKGFWQKYKDEGDLVRFSGYFIKGDGKPAHTCLSDNRYHWEGVRANQGYELGFHQWNFKFTKIEKLYLIP